MTTVVITQPMLFPWPGFFEQLALADIYVYLDDAQFSKGSFTNRVQVKTGDQVKWMTIPLAGGGTYKAIKDLDATTADWRATHQLLLKQSLANAPHAKDAVDILDEAYRQEKLCDALIQSIELSAAYIGIGKSRRITHSSALNIPGSSWKRVLDIVLSLGGTRYLTGHGAARYMDHEAFEANGVSVEYMDYSLTPWPQGDAAFTPYVSILNLIGHAGCDANRYLTPRTTHWREFLAKQAP
ncbi:WbqC family protein [Labrys sp. KNU-23]|uniref:WbqC family protein n=1 Tax=Labrys sp. KNU-23 TaxID=2789216 RepID=UPI0011ECA9E9|nr:WbqC family protein [Labrys sp. KNU-23]QEN87269.1 WbqC family protein [Labrys sp. KNU-23]